jgi:hypothetical protein
MNATQKDLRDLEVSEILTKWEFLFRGWKKFPDWANELDTWDTKLTLGLGFKNETRRILYHLRAGLEKGDGTFFRILADNIERRKNPPEDKLLRFLLDEYFKINVPPQYPPLTQRWPYPTAREISDKLSALKIVIDERQLRRVCENIGLRLSKAKTGRPRTNKTRTIRKRRLP